MCSLYQITTTQTECSILTQSSHLYSPSCRKRLKCITAAHQHPPATLIPHAMTGTTPTPPPPTPPRRRSTHHAQLVERPGRVQMQHSRGPPNGPAWLAQIKFMGELASSYSRYIPRFAALATDQMEQTAMLSDGANLVLVLAILGTRL